jgi:iron complex outermembrane receptor protein
LKSITGYLYQDSLQRDSDQDATPFYSIGSFTETTRHMRASGIDADSEERLFLSQEFNLFGSAFNEKLDYTLGVYASDETIEDQAGGNTLSLGGWMGGARGSEDKIGTIPPAAIAYRGASLLELTSQSAAAFGQLIYYFNDMWQFTLGGRYTWEEKAIDQQNFITTQGPIGNVSREEMNALANFLQPNVVNPENPRQEDKQDWSEFSPAATVTMFAPGSWTEGFLDTGMFYLSYSEGFKAGGFSSFGTETVVFDPEIVQSTELGFKMDMADHRLRLNGAVYFMDYDDMQLGVTRTFGEFNSSFGITNAGKAEMTGAELELSFLPLEGLLISFTGSYIDAEYTEFDDEFTNDMGETELSDRSDESFQHVPEQTYSWVIQYDWDTSFALIIPRISGSYKDSVYIGQDVAAFEFEDDSTLDSFTIWNARLAFQSNQIQGLEVALYANNFTDEFYYGTGNVNAGLIGASSLIRGKPKSYGMEFYYNW